MIIEKNPNEIPESELNKVEQPIDQKLPEGAVLTGIKATCPKHGDVTAATLFLTYTTINKDKQAIQHQNMFCIRCLSELLQEFQAQGKIQKLEVERQYMKKEDYQKVQEELEKRKQMQSNENKNTFTPEELTEFKKQAAAVTAHEFQTIAADIEAEKKNN